MGWVCVELVWILCLRVYVLFVFGLFVWLVDNCCCFGYCCCLLVIVCDLCFDLLVTKVMNLIVLFDTLVFVCSNDLFLN